ncbi:MAG: hypothetical protein GTO02_08465 [Candidatus Dadabacteria bacterium]|nr:hypothetical protein [Candidatus Dadabacteria bacterium]NIQ14420.1 hypothetical protein [Candidatus Dadabacteria bacterium]
MERTNSNNQTNKILLIKLIKYLFFLRIPITFLSLLILLAILGIWGPSTVQNVFITENIYGKTKDLILLAFICFLTIQTSYLCGFTFLLIKRRATDRFFSYENLKFNSNEENPYFNSSIYFTLFSLPIFFVLLLKSTYAILPTFIAIFSGVASGLIFLYVINRFIQISSNKNKSSDKIYNIFYKLTKFLGSGYFDFNENRPHKGHYVALVSALVIIIFYCAFSWLLNPKAPLIHIPPFGYVLGLLLVLVSILSSFTFFLDRYRIPLTVVLFLIFLFNYGVFRTDHFFIIQEAEELAENVNEIKIPGIVEDSKQRLNENNNVITLISANGGGIKAAAWTTSVITNLSNEFPELAKSIHLISSASGGSVGAYFYLEALNYANCIGKEYLIQNNEFLELIFQASTKSSLEQTLWGILYPDLLRIFLTPFINKYEDRAWAMEVAWATYSKIMKNKIDSLAFDNSNIDLKTQTDLDNCKKETLFSEWVNYKNKIYKLPNVAFNTSIVQNGLLVPVSTLNFRNSDNPKNILSGKTFYDVYHKKHKNLDINAVTAARLSASFPYVTPVSKASFYGCEGNKNKKNCKKEGLLPNLHHADGGYFDNYGTVPIVEWINTAMNVKYLEKKIDKILILEIIAGPKKNYDKLGDPSYNTENGALNALFGPIFTILNVRDSSQLERSKLELNQLKIKYKEKLEIVQFHLNSKENLPLSWHLTKDNICEIKNVYFNDDNEKSRKKISALFDSTKVLKSENTYCNN